MKKLFVIITTGILLLLNSPLVFPEEPVFAPEEHCLAYKTVKTMFFFADVDVIGKSCNVTAEMHWEESGEKAQVEVSVPVKTLDSGNPFRDGDIPEILKADLTPNIRFVSVWLEKSAWDKMMEGQLPEVSGNLEVAGGIFPVKFALSFSKQAGFLLVEGQLKTTFSALNVDVPLVAGGLIADPQDELELQLHLRLDKIAGAEKIKNNK